MFRQRSFRRTPRSSGLSPLRLGIGLASVALAALLGAGCSLTSPTSPNDPAQLTGQNPNEEPSFNGTITLTASSTTSPADGSTDVLITATARDPEGRPVQNLTPINFSTDLGLLRPAGTSPALGSSSVTVGAFNGRATVALRSTVAGVATVGAAIANVASFVDIVLERVPIQGNIDLVFLGGSEFASGTASPSSPFRIGLVATAKDLDGNLLAGVIVRFEIVVDTTTGSGNGPARLEGQEASFTNTAGEAFDQLVIVGAGRVVLEANLFDPNDGSHVATSNQIIAVTDSAGVDFTVTLTFDDGTTVSEATAPFTDGIEALVQDSTGAAVPGRTVRFTIIRDTTSGATLGANGTSVTVTTDGSGVATTSVRVPDPGEVVIIAELLDDAGNVIATSNEITAVGT